MNFLSSTISILVEESDKTYKTVDDDLLLKMHCYELLFQ